jgi:hypothetical protein
VYGAAVAKNVMPLQLIKGCSAASPAMGSVSSNEEVHCKVEVSAAAVQVLPLPQPLPRHVYLQLFGNLVKPCFPFLPQSLSVPFYCRAL